jgi:hypothetical protein
VEYKESLQISDPVVTKRKFDTEVSKFNIVELKYRERGIICSKISFPNMFFIFAIPKLTPPVVAFSVRINFTNFDFEPPSVVFVNPFTEGLVRRDQVPMIFIQLNKNPPFQPLDLLQGHGNMVPFFCIPGVREYHDHPAHSGDSWFLYRTRGEGNLLFIIDQLYNNSIATAKSYQAVLNLTDFKMQIQQEIKINK